MSMLFSPVGLSPPAQAHRGGKSRALLSFTLRETLFPGREMLLLHPGAMDGHVAHVALFSRGGKVGTEVTCQAH